MKFTTQNPEKSLHLVSLGCTKNLVDSEIMLGKLKEYKISDDATSADVLIVNTCGFIDSAKEESINTILDLHDQRKEESVLVVAGCLTQRYQEELQKEIPEVDIFTGVGDYDKIDELVNEKRSAFTNQVFLASDTNERVITGSSYHAYVKLSEGCNQACSFCAIPSFKGKLHSRTLQSLVKEVSSLVSKGYTDFTFISQDSSSFLRDQDQKDGLEQLISEVEKIEGIKTARILYLYPSTTTLDLIDKIADSKVFQNYFDMPLQHITPSMLKIMKRGKGVEKLIELMDHMKSKPNSFVRTTFIAGHPGETIEDHEALCEYIKNYKFDRANVFSYSTEEGTTAAKSDMLIEQEVIDNRADEIGEIIAQTTQESLEAEVGKTFEVYIDGESDEHEFLLSARKTTWAPDIDGEIYINDNELYDENNPKQLEFGKIYSVRVTELSGDKLLATVIK
ncbi:30S ribosomal protein S12 methylthiotransferase RimO [Poseidonibacter ostreae]|jgi:ribosomal protein S12 methylthiotransferase|uniref:Ribosomal protein uS12 methylthiotransferase RimO n=1 Tax=Poseidonibacter ostreae TaxID=2654171 RepID=A0A6L4WQB7_9BACT|nr:30S ribosomal protein S12 methylthiotransferase RimO [Poseidonibacter ostreae]KAB7881202.1 30S ribosomal protein S12 methylthiotransferase RimO [Poseidonibacter ostreae]KAB7886466.1 30S ribosomal protein S12 methylthiotransferase RimO [Poseidonibacter ostreae]KAB7891826.1 30S ribosomal protein S12 methylthiotransferase RimO [Poseidonibacter ostreae]MAC83341.1 30S ribosomal protein S12 methylthiotransferase RimO [Arcobacter sp.]|tara:strand:+ start:60 stop:1409 length:1350 start_codon:yes stop_codon:yes gene_type:complete